MIKYIFNKLADWYIGLFFDTEYKKDKDGNTYEYKRYY